MTIKEFAGLAGVSVSTVSKIMNGKDGSIGKETREKVLFLAKEYGYTPYANILQAGTKRFLVGVLLNGNKEDRKFLFYLTKEATRHGYNMVCCFHGGDEKEEEKAIHRLCAQNVEAIIWSPSGKQRVDVSLLMEKRGIKLYPYGVDYHKVKNLDYGTLSYEAVLYLMEKKHRKIAYIAAKGIHSLGFEKGIHRCVYDSQRENTEIEWELHQSVRELKLSGVTAILCESEELGIAVLKKAKKEGVKVPEALSVMALGMGDSTELMIPCLTMIEIPLEALGIDIFRTVLFELEGKEAEVKKELPITLIHGETVQSLFREQLKKIVVVGSINMDVIINVDDFGDGGQTVMAHSMHSFPGGKGSNQAVGAAKLGASVSLIGKVGEDYEGKVIRDNMLRYGVKLDGIQETSLAGTGKAFITVQNNGESSVVVYSGANKSLSREDILQAEHVFEDASFCLLQLETPAQTIQLAAELATKKGARVILKPAATKEVEEDLLKYIDIFIPNRKELEVLIPGDQTLEEKTQFFLDKGVAQVIVTLGKHGCYFKNYEHSIYISPGDFVAVDTTGAADAFISALAVSLMEGYEIIDAIKFATYAAGISVTRPGAQPALVDRVTMDLYQDQIQKEIQTRTETMF